MSRLITIQSSRDDNFSGVALQKAIRILFSEGVRVAGGAVNHYADGTTNATILLQDERDRPRASHILSSAGMTAEYVWITRAMLQKSDVMIVFALGMMLTGFALFSIWHNDEYAREIRVSPAQPVATGLHRPFWGAAHPPWDVMTVAINQESIMNKMCPVVHFEMPAEDRQRIAKFYQRAFGWQTQMLGEEMGNYVLARTTESDERGPKRRGAINGGFFPKKPDWPAQYPSVVIAVDDIKAAMKEVAEAGGQVLGEPMQIPGVGHYVSFFDTEGNRMSMLQPASSNWH